MRLHRYVSDRHTASERGSDLGQRWAGPIGAAVEAYRAYFRRLGLDDATVRRIAEASLDAVEDWCSPLAAEMAGIAAGAGRRVGDVVMLNARTEILAQAPRLGAGECSTAVRLPIDGRGLVAFQTWDWHPELARDGLLWRYEPEPGRRVKTFTECGMLAKIGVSSAGLAVHFNILRHDSDTAAGGVPVHVVARRILDAAASVDEAYEIVRSAPVGASTVLTVVAAGPGRTPDAASIEIAPAGAAMVRPRDDGWLLHTNHFLSPDLEAGDRPTPDSTSRARLDHLDKVVGEVDDGAAHLRAVARAMCGPAGPDAAICLAGATIGVEGLPRSQTLLTVRLDPIAGVIECWPGTPYEAAEADRVERF